MCHGAYGLKVVALCSLALCSFAFYSRLQALYYCMMYRSVTKDSEGLKGCQASTADFRHQKQTSGTSLKLITANGL